MGHKQEGCEEAKEEASKRLTDALGSMTVSSSRIASQEVEVEKSKMTLAKSMRLRGSLRSIYCS